MFISTNVYLFHGIISNYYIIDNHTDLHLIDCGMAMDFRHIKRSLIGLGYPQKPLKSILVTHADGDHYGSAARLKDVTGASIAARPTEKEAMSAGKSSRPLRRSGISGFLAGIISPMFSSPPVQVEQCITEPMTFSILEGLQAVFTPGHTPEHCSFWLPEERILFAGDSIWEVSGRPAPTFGMNCWDSRLAQQSFEIQMNLKPVVICSGHTCIHIQNSKG